MNNNPVVIVTGASRGMGADTARLLAGAGASVVLTARSKALLSKVADDVKRLGGLSHEVRANLSEASEAQRIASETLDRFGKIDALVNNAGIIEPVAPIADTSPEEWEDNIKVNLVAPYLLTRACLPALRKTSGRVINISSGAAASAVEAWSAYCTAKAGLTHFTRVLAAEEKSITAVSVRPGVVDTAMQEAIRTLGPGNMPAESLSRFMNLKAENGLEPPMVPARSIAWLSLYAGSEFSGSFVEYDDPRIMEPAKEIFGDNLLLK